MKRTTTDMLLKMAATCEREAPQKNGWHYTIEIAYGRPRLVLQDGKACVRDVSPRLPSGRLAEWIWAYLEGVRAVKG